MNTRNREFETALALLDLQREYVCCSANNREDMEKTARSAVPNYNLLGPNRSAADHPIKIPTTEVKTREVATQTEECHNPNIESMKTKIKDVCERIQLLEAQLKEPDEPPESSGFISSENVQIAHNDKSYRSHNSASDMSLDENTNDEFSVNQFVQYSGKIHYEDKNKSKKHNRNKKRVLSIHNTLKNSSDLVPIGNGHATVSARVLKYINWNSYTSATRKLLTAVFSRRILATHTLTGKPSPAFPNKPAKKKLDSALVKDIVQTVVERCSVPENIVRTSITTKCADESKMFKTRQNKNKRRSSKNKHANVFPTTSESESESC